MSITLPPTGSIYYNVLEGYFGALDQNNLDAIWGTFLSMKHLTSNPTDNSLAGAFTSYVQALYSQMQTESLSPAAIAQQHITLSIFDILTLLMQHLQNSLSVQTSQQQFYAQLAQQYNNMQEAVPVYRVDPSQMGAPSDASLNPPTNTLVNFSNLNTSNYNQLTFGYDNISLKDITDWCFANSGQSFVLPIGNYQQPFGAGGQWPGGGPPANNIGNTNPLTQNSNANLLCEINYTFEYNATNNTFSCTYNYVPNPTIASIPSFQDNLPFLESNGTPIPAFTVGGPINLGVEAANGISKETAAINAFEIAQSPVVVTSSTFSSRYGVPVGTYIGTLNAHTVNPIIYQLHTEADPNADDYTTALQQCAAANSALAQSFAGIKAQQQTIQNQINTSNTNIQATVSALQQQQSIMQAVIHQLQSVMGVLFK